MKSNYSILLCLMLIMSCSGKQKSIEKTISSIEETINLKPEEAKQCIITTHYEPIFHDGEWICGEKYSRIHFISDTVFYDEFNNKLLFIIDGGHIVNRYIYKSHKDKLLDKIYSLSLSEIGSALFIRDSENQLNEVIVSGNIYDFNIESRKYYRKNNGEIKEIDTEDYRTIFEQSPSEKGLSVRTSNKYKKNNNSSSDEDHELIEKETIISNSNEQVVRMLSERYKYGKTQDKINITFTYDGMNRLIKEEGEGKKNSSIYTRVPKDLIGEEREEFLKKEYLMNLEYVPTSYSKEWKYNEYGDLESFIFKNTDESGKLKIEPSSCERYEYVYDDKGNWIKKYSFDMFEMNTIIENGYARDSYSSKLSNEPYLISIREIIDL